MSFPPPNRVQVCSGDLWIHRKAYVAYWIQILKLHPIKPTSSCELLNIISSDEHVFFFIGILFLH